ncbi:MAG: hypothetical protein IKV76_00120 [Clostridia bacterium]|nr:hypothetical protein [Clostridia bacterium]
MNEIEIIKRRLADLSEMSVRRNTWEFSKFLNPAEQSELLRMKSLNKFELFGGYEGAERRIAVFGNEDNTGYEYIAPVSFVSVAPVNDKFSDNLSHRDFLGALMSLGINRDMIGDIIVKDNSAVIICIDTAAEYIVSELDRIKHTSVRCAVTDTIPEAVAPQLSEEEFIVSSERIDVLLSGVYNLSRNESQILIDSEKVFCDSRLVISTSLIPKTGQIISARGFGRFVYEGVIRTTKKNRLIISVKKYI